MTNSFAKPGWNERVSYDPQRSLGLSPHVLDFCSRTFQAQVSLLDLGTLIVIPSQGVGIFSQYAGRVPQRLEHSGLSSLRSRAGRSG